MNECIIFMEWRIRKLNPPSPRPKENYEERCKRWILYSLGFDEKAQNIFLLIERKNMITVDEIVDNVGLSLEEVEDIVDRLYSYGLIDKIGKAYFIRKTLSESIIGNLIPRLTDTLQMIAKVDSSLRVKKNSFRGKIFSNVRDFITRYRDMLDSESKIRIRVIGVIPDSERGIEERGIVKSYDYWDRIIEIITFDGKTIIVGDRANGVDIKVNTIIVEEM